MEASTRISIVTPSYNQGRFIERTLQSVLSQDIGGLEYLVMDAGSTDETLSVLERYADRLTWGSEPDRGPSDAINKGFHRASGPILGWLNSDDIYYPGTLKAVLAFFERHPDVGVVYGDTHHIDEHDSILEVYPTEEWNWERLKETCFISQPAAFFRRRVFEEFGPLAVGIRGMDYDFWLRLGKNHVRFAHLPKFLAATRLHKDAFTMAQRIAVHSEINSITRHHLSRTPDIWLFGYAHAVAEAWGYTRDRIVSFRLIIAAASLYAAIRWNRRVSKKMLKMIMRWIS
jgi:glycosyltransferase involved in cell wall biosynthesis